MLYVLNQDFPSFYRLELLDDRLLADRRSRFGPPDAASVQRGQTLYTESCAPCHGADRAGTPAAPSLLNAGKQIGFPQLKRTILYGNGRMPPIGHIGDDQMGDILAFLGGGARPRFRSDPKEKPALPAGPVVASGGAPRAATAPAAAPPAPEAYPAGIEAPAQRHITDYGLGYPYLLAPPWSTIIAYDLNRGVIKWRMPLGQDRDAAAAGGKGTGLPRGSQRQGMIVTSTGIVFSTARDGVLYAFDAENGEVLWSAQLPMGTEGLPAAYQVRGKTYIVVNATTPRTWGLNSRESGIGSSEPLGKGGYVVFAVK
jgi:quinoprotein glucose dehydrogenase